MTKTTKIRVAHKKRNSRRRLIRVLLILSAGVILIHVSINLYLGFLIQHQIDRFHLKHPGLYRIDFKRARANLLTGSLTLKQFNLIPAALTRQTPIKNGKDPELWEVTIPLLKLKGIDWISYLFNHNLEIGGIILKNACVKRFSSTPNHQGKSGSVDRKKRGALFPWPVKSIQVKYVDVQNCCFQEIQMLEASRKDRRYEFDFKAYDSSIQCNDADPSYSIPDLKSLQCVIKELRLTLPDRLYSLNIQEMSVSAPLSRISIRNLEINPRYDKFDFSRELGYRKSRIYFFTRWVQFNNIIIDDILTLEGLKSDILAVRGFRWEFFRDKRVPLSRSFRPKKFPQEILRGFGFPVRIDRVKLSRGHLVVEEIGENSEKPVSIFFSDFQTDIFNLTNDPVLLDKNPILTARATARLMGKSKFTLDLSTTIQDKQDRFSFTGTLESLDVRILNPILNNTEIHIENGILHKLHFSANASRYQSRGSMIAHYNGLKISILSKKNNLKKEKIVSFFANLIILSNNPRGRTSLRVGNMYFRRTAPRSMLNLMWKSFLNGIKSSIGLKRKKR